MVGLLVFSSQRFLFLGAEIILFIIIMFLRLRIIIVLLLCGECPPLWRVSSNKKVSTFLLLGTPWPNLTETALIACRGERAPFGPAFWGST